MARRYSRRRYSGYSRSYRPANQKYQFVPFSMTLNPEPSVSSPNASLGGAYHVVVPSIEVAGIRKAKNFNLNFVTNSTDPLIYALVYLPEGARAESFVPDINLGTSDNTNDFVELFPANQWVIACGSISQGAQNRMYSRMARNLNNGDSIYLYIWRINTESTEFIAVNATGSYAIKYN